MRTLEITELIDSDRHHRTTATWAPVVCDRNLGGLIVPNSVKLTDLVPLKPLVHQTSDVLGSGNAGAAFTALSNATRNAHGLATGREQLVGQLGPHRLRTRVERTEINLRKTFDLLWSIRLCGGNRRRLWTLFRRATFRLLAAHKRAKSNRHPQDWQSWQARFSKANDHGSGFAIGHELGFDHLLVDARSNMLFEAVGNGEHKIIYTRVFDQFAKQGAGLPTVFVSKKLTNVVDGNSTLKVDISVFDKIPRKLIHV